MIRLIIWIKTKLHGQLVGHDELGNSYYESKKPARFFGRKDRWVIYNGCIEASKIPGQWFNWLHYQSDELPKKHKRLRWEKAHRPNLTGTKSAYYPSSKSPSEVTGDYERWTYNQVKHLQGEKK